MSPPTGCGRSWMVCRTRRPRSCSGTVRIPPTRRGRCEFSAPMRTPRPSTSSIGVRRRTTSATPTTWRFGRHIFEEIGLFLDWQRAADSELLHRLASRRPDLRPVYQPLDEGDPHGVSSRSGPRPTSVAVHENQLENRDVSGTQYRAASGSVAISDARWVSAESGGRVDVCRGSADGRRPESPRHQPESGPPRPSRARRVSGAKTASPEAGRC